MISIVNDDLGIRMCIHVLNVYNIEFQICQITGLILDTNEKMQIHWHKQCISSKFILHMTMVFSQVESKLSFQQLQNKIDNKTGTGTKDKQMYCCNTKKS